MDAKLSKLVLYSYWRSSSSWRIRIILNLKKIQYEIKPVNLLKGEHKTEEFLAINPLHKIPALIVTDNNNKSFNLAESTAIAEFIEETYPEPRLLPQDIFEKAKVRTVCSEVACNIQPIQNLPVLNMINELGQDKAAWAKTWITRGLQDLEKLLLTTRGKYCVGDNVTLADAFLIPQLYNARRFNVDFNEFPNIAEIEKNLVELEAFKQAHADNQPDAVVENK